jgi:hypothetical protein
MLSRAKRSRIRLDFTAGDPSAASAECEAGRSMRVATDDRESQENKMDHTSDLRDLAALPEISRSARDDNAVKAMLFCEK